MPGSTKHVKAHSRPRSDGPAAAKVLAVSSSGGHWVQLQRLVPAFDDCDVIFATTEPGYAVEIAPRRLHVVRDATRWDRFGSLVLLFQMARLVVRERPDVVITTGAAPGCFAVIFGRLFGARTIWVDSIANVERMSLSGRLVRPFTGLWLTQWPELAEGKDAPSYAGAVF
jgi:UDP-N-acetylglucosamine:LPS N-acetylglucosamine transferase